MHHESEGIRSGPDADDDAHFGDLEIVFQPIVELATGATAAVEALARFGQAPERSADDVIREAYRRGFGEALEAACVRRALDRRNELPEGVRMAINLSPDVLSLPAVVNVWDDDLEGVIIEITEHAAGDPVAMEQVLRKLRSRGALIAVDDVGSGYAGLLRLATMRPDYVKIDKTIVRGLRDHVAQQAVLESLVTLSQRMGAATIGEGIESLDDLGPLADFDVDLGQGWAIGRPASRFAPVDPSVAAACRDARGTALQRLEALGASAGYMHGMHAVTSAMSSATGLAELRAAVHQAADEISVDNIGVSVLGTDGLLREIVSAGAALDDAAYSLADFPATRTVLETGNTIEAHVNDPRADPAEKAVLVAGGFASLLMVPLYVQGSPIGILEFGHRSYRRWTSHDIAHGRGLAAHLGQALARMIPDTMSDAGRASSRRRSPVKPVIA